MNADLLIKGALALTSIISLGLGMVQSDRAEKRSNQLIRDAAKESVKEELQKKERWRKKPN